MQDNEAYSGNELRIAKEAVQALAKAWKFLLVCTVIGLLWGIHSLKTAHNVYAAQMTVTAVTTTGEDATSARLSALGGLASLAGFNTPAAQNTTQFRLFVEKIHSRELADALARNQHLMTQLYRGEWDAAAKQWRAPQPGLLASAEQMGWRLLGANPRPWSPPDGARLQGYLALFVKADPDTRRPYLQTISFNTQNPALAIELLTDIGTTADTLLRQKALVRAQQYINYLTDELGKVTIEEHREAILQTLSEQEKFLMVASSAAPYAAEVFDKPSVSPTPVSPRPARVIAEHLALGALAGSLLVLLGKYFGGEGRVFLRRFGMTRGLPRFITQSMGL